MCMMDNAEYYYQSAVDNGRVMRRADRTCDDCGRPIAKGETYVHGQWSEGRRYDDKDYLDFPDLPPHHPDNGYSRPNPKDWSVAVQCLHCEAATAWLIHACSGFLYVAVKDDLWEHVGGEEADERTPQLTRLYRWMDAKWVRRDGTLRPVEQVQAQAQLAIDAYDRRHARLLAEVGR